MITIKLDENVIAQQKQLGYVDLSENITNILSKLNRTFDNFEFVLNPEDNSYHGSFRGACRPFNIAETCFIQCEFNGINHEDFSKHIKPLLG